MQLVDVTLSELTRRSRAVRVAHSAAGLSRGLDLGESLLVRDETGFYSAIVADIEFELEDTIYLLTIGGRIPEEQAEEKLAGRAPAYDDRSLTLHDVIDLLGQARTARVPEQRRSSASQSEARSGASPSEARSGAER